MGSFVWHFESPFFGFSLALFPGFGAEAFLIGINFEHLIVSFQDDVVTLIDKADLGHFVLPLVSVTHHVRLDGIVLRFRRAEENGCALKEPVISRFGENLAAVFFAHIEFEPGADPWQWGVGPRNSVR